VASFPQGFPPEHCIHLSSSPYVLHAFPIFVLRRVVLL
jgi:hypothetical protein